MLGKRGKTNISSYGLASFKVQSIMKKEKNKSSKTKWNYIFYTNWTTCAQNTTCYHVPKSCKNICNEYLNY